MSRYRAPQKTGSLYITAAGEAKLKQELHQLWKVERPQITQSVTAAAAMGDRSENADYIYGKKRLREIDRRVRYLSQRLEQIKVVIDPPSDLNKIYFGAFVSLEDEQEKVVTYRLVGPDEIDPKLGYISIDAPLGRALLSKQLDSEIEIELPTGPKRYCVVGIKYQI